MVFRVESMFNACPVFIGREERPLLLLLFLRPVVADHIPRSLGRCMDMLLFLRNIGTVKRSQRDSDPFGDIAFTKPCKR